MAYKLAEEDKLCGIEYPTYEGFKPIPKATCDMLKPQCNDIEIVLNCDKKKEEEKPTPEPTPQPKPTPDEPKPQPEPSPTPNPEEPQPTPQPQPEEPKPQPNPVEPTPEPEPAPKPVLTNEELDTIVSGKLSTNTTLGNYYVNQNNIITLIGEAPTEDIEAYKKEITDRVGDIPELKGYTVEVVVNKINGDNVGEKSTGAPLYTRVLKITKPNGDVYQSEPMSIGTTTETTIDLLEALPRVEDKFSKIITKDGQVVEVPEVSNEDKRAFEDKIINDLKAKLPEGTVVEAVLEGPKYEKGSEVLSGKTNYVLNVRTTLNGVVSEQTYNVPHTEEAPKEEPEAPEELPNEEIKAIRDEWDILKKDHFLGLLFINPMSTNTYGTESGVEGTKFAIEKLKEKFPEYTIDYTINTSDIIPIKPTDKGEEYLQKVKFTVTKGERSSKFTEYMPYEITQVDYL